MRLAVTPAPARSGAAGGAGQGATAPGPGRAAISGIVSHWPMDSPVRIGELRELRIGLAEELDNETRQRDARSEHAHQQPRAVPRARLPEQRKHDDSQHRPFQHRLVKLARVARQGPGVGKHHRPRHAGPGHASPQLAIDEVGEPAEHHPERHADRQCNRPPAGSRAGRATTPRRSPARSRSARRGSSCRRSTAAAASQGTAPTARARRTSHSRAVPPRMMPSVQ